MLLMFLLLKIEKDEEITQLLQSMKFSTFALNILELPGLEYIKTALSKGEETEKDEGLQKNMGLAGFDKGYFIADYIYLFAILIIIGFFHLLFFLTIRIPETPESIVENAIVTIDRIFNYSIYIRISLSSYFYMLISILNDFSQINSGWRRIVSFLASLVVLVYLVFFFLFVVIHYCKNRDKPYDPNDKYQVLYQGMRETRWARFYNTLYLLRRISLAIIIVSGEVAFQLSVIAIIQIATL